MNVRCFYGGELCSEFLSYLRSALLSNSVIPLYVIASTRTSLIPGISLAGANPELTLLTPTLDVEYLLMGRVLSMDLIPTTPEGIPTPALITRACLNLVGLKGLVVNAGVFKDPKVPHVVLPSKCVGGRIDTEYALPKGTSERLFNEAKLLGSSMGRYFKLVVIGESMAGGTTTALSIMSALGFNAWGRVSSSAPNNPLKLKEEVVKKALSRLRGNESVFEINDLVGDPLHISIAGLAVGALKVGAKVLLGGGTQMCAVLAILNRLGITGSNSLAIGTTSWLVKFTPTIKDLVSDILPTVPIIYADLSFSNSRFEGLRKYEVGYVKEGVGAGASAILALAKGFDVEEVVKSIEDEYERVIKSVK